MTAKEYKLTCTTNEMQSIQVTGPADAAVFAANFFEDDINIYESCFIILLNRANKIIGWYKVSSGGLDATIIDKRIICKVAIDALSAGVIPDPKKMGMVAVRLDFAGIRRFEADFKAKKKLNKGMEGYVRVGGCLFKLDYLIKAVRFMEHVGTDEFMVSPDGKRAALAVSGDSKMILMPVYPRTKFEDNEVCYG